MEEQGWLSVHRQAIDGTNRSRSSPFLVTHSLPNRVEALSAKELELQRVREDFERRTQDLIRTQEELRTTSEARVRLEERIRQTSGLQDELSQTKAELRLAVNRREVMERERFIRFLE